jgi:phytoene/squalene synthetase
MSSTKLPAVSGLPTRAAVMVQAREENFPVALWLLGPRLRRHLLAVYGFARLVDDVGDELTGDRLALLDQIEHELDEPRHEVMLTLAATIRECRLPRGPFLRLIEANRRDQVVTRYESLEELLDYCQLSAAPVGELVLHVFGAATPERIALSDRICSALQIIEHLQDVDEDRARGRFYLGPPTTPNRPFAGTSEARALLEQGAPLVAQLRGRARLAVAGFLAGGRVALDALDGHRRAFPPTYVKALAGR